MLGVWPVQGVLPTPNATMGQVRCLVSLSSESVTTTFGSTFSGSPARTSGCSLLLGVPPATCNLRCTFGLTLCGLRSHLQPLAPLGAPSIVHTFGPTAGPTSGHTTRRAIIFPRLASPYVLLPPAELSYLVGRRWSSCPRPAPHLVVGL